MQPEFCNQSSEKLKKINDVELIKRCLDNHRPFWNEFFRRFIPVIKTAIKDKLEGSGYYGLAGDKDVVDEIFYKVVVKLYKDEGLKKCQKPASISPWLKTLARNQVSDWLRWKKRKKRMPEFQVENSKLYLSSRLKDGSEITVEDTLSDDVREHDIIDFIESSPEEDRILPLVDNIRNEKKKWILRLSIVAYEPLAKDELKRLRRFNKFPADEFSEIISQMMIQVKQKYDEKNKNQSKAVMYWYELRKLEYILLETEKSIDGETPHIIDLREKIKRKKKKYEVLLHKGERVIRPDNRIIAKLIGIPLEQAGQISVNLIRIRSEMHDRLMKNQN